METSLSRFRNILAANRRGDPVGICSVCSSHPYAIRAALAQATKDETIALVESTSNQVNQFGGYTGMKPADFVRYVREAALQSGFPSERLLFGGDHLGPFPWRDKPAVEALDLAADMVRAYVSAGYTKIHLDVSMYLGDDRRIEGRPLEAEAVAARTADLCVFAEETWEREHTDASRPVYIIGNEVPVPGGTSAEQGELRPTSPADLLESLEAMEAAFRSHGLTDAWKRVVGVVVQPGVEFGDDFVHDYDPDKATGLVSTLEDLPALVYEAHSTDYQLAPNLARLVADHFAILKVGPALTFAFREAVCSLEAIEAELLRGRTAERSNLLATVLDSMKEQDRYWRSYYQGTPEEVELDLCYSLSDRIRYYWSTPKAQAALARLMSNLASRSIPLSLLSQHLPLEYEKVRQGFIRPSADELILSHVMEVTEAYALACFPERPPAGPDGAQ